MRRALIVLVLGALGLVGLTACMSDSDESAGSTTPRRTAALVEAGKPTTGRYELVIDGLTPAGKAIEVDQYSWGVSRPAATGAARFNSLEIVKKVDAMSPLLSLGVASGTHYTTATLKLYADSGGKPVNYATYTLTDVELLSDTHSGTSANIPSEQVTLNYARLEASISEPGEAGEEAPTQQFGWNIKENSKL
jgi:type VI protein secretion system component Hcp